MGAARGIAPSFVAVDGRRIAAALLVLAIGALVYVTARPASTYLAVLFNGVPFPRVNLGPVGGSLPTFCHMFALGLITGELLRPWLTMSRASVFAWALIEVAVEIAQLDPVALTVQSIVTSSLGGAFSRLVGDFFVHSTFDGFDLLAVLLGGFAAWCGLTLREESS